MLEYAIYMQQGMGMAEAGLTANRIALGSFFAISGYHKLFNAARHAAVLATMKKCRIPFPRFNSWFVPLIEFKAGLALIAGVLAPLAAVGLAVICLVAICTDGLGRIPAYSPIDKADWLDDLLYLPEVLYVFGLVIIITAGPGPFVLTNIL